MQHKLSSSFQMTKVGRDYNIVLQYNTSKACSDRKKKKGGTVEDTTENKV